MKSYSYSEARGNFATVLDEAERDAAVEIRRRAMAPCSAFFPCGFTLLTMVSYYHICGRLLPHA